MVVQLTPEGLVFGADRNITSQSTLSGGSTVITVSGQAQRPKVLKWPNHEVIVGYVGVAEVDGRPMDEWLYHDFIGSHLNFPSLKSFADDLTAELDGRFQRGDFNGQPSILHLGGFEPTLGGDYMPHVYFIRNTAALLPNGAYQVGAQFDCSEELSTPVYFGGKSPQAVRQHVTNGYFSFRQGYDLEAFNTIDVHLRAALETLATHTNPAAARARPTTLAGWGEHVSFEINAYGAYFASFYPPFEQFVGGGADVVWAAWP